MAKKKPKDNFDALAKEMGEYMRGKGWDILAIHEPLIHQHFGELNYNFELVFRFTGKKIEVPKET